MAHYLSPIKETPKEPDAPDKLAGGTIVITSPTSKVIGDIVNVTTPPEDRFIVPIDPGVLISFLIVHTKVAAVPVNHPWLAATLDVVKLIGVTNGNINSYGLVPETAIVS
jgi:hypothetical protein